MKESTKHSALRAAAVTLAILGIASFILFLCQSPKSKPDSTASASDSPSAQTLTRPPRNFATARSGSSAGVLTSASFNALDRESFELTEGGHWGKASPDDAPIFNQFAEWTARYLAANSPDERSALEAEGVRLATERRAALSNLIRDDPERALAHSIPFHIRQSLPSSLAPFLEESISGRGRLAVLGALPESGRESEVTPAIRTALIGEREFDVFVYGRRLGEPTRWDVPLNGIAIGRLLAVGENPVRVLSAAEAIVRAPAPAEPICSVSGQSALLNNTPMAAEIGGQIVRICGVRHAMELNGRLIRAVAVGGDGAATEGDVAASGFTEGTKRLLIIRIDFSDLPGDGLATNAATSLISGLNDFYRESSRGRAGFFLNGNGSSITATLRMPRTASFYGTNNAFSRLQDDARAAAMAAGFNPANYDFDLTCFGAVPGWGWAGLGWVGAPGVWLRNQFSVGVASHELGHNFGLNHANFWDTQGRSVIGSGGHGSVEYGDVFDTMGSAAAGANHFNARYKSYLNWLTPAEVQTVTSSGTYRIQAHDDTNSTGVLALRIPRSASTNYWVEFRQKFLANPWMMSGASLRWAANGNQKSDLLDTTPGSVNGKNDSALVVGRTFSDPTAGIHVTTLRKTGTSPEALEVVVNFGAFPGNIPPTVLVAGAASVAPGASISFTASATDSNGDALAYYWDFGDGTFGTNGAVASKSWGATGEYLVQCTVSDMKGGAASDSVIVTVGLPNSYRISGRVTAGGAPVMGARISVSPTRVACTDSDGTYALVGLPASGYSVSATFDGYTFLPSGFANPIAVGPSLTDVNFAAAGLVAVALTNPTNNSVFIAPNSIPLTATATPATGNTLRKIEFYAGGAKLGEDSAAPYGLSWNGPAIGVFALSAVAIDSGGIRATSAPVTVIVSSSAPYIITQPESQLVPAGTEVALAVRATGIGPLNYQWRRDGVALSGYTNSSLEWAAVAPNDSGRYSVVIGNSQGTATSVVAELAVVCPINLSLSAAAYPSAGGNGGVAVTAYSACAWVVTGVPAWIQLTSTSSGGGNALVTYTVASNASLNARSATLSIGGASHVISQMGSDFTPPGVTITSPAIGTITSEAVLQLRGSASDNGMLSRVEYRVGAGSYATAAGTTAWSAAVSLAVGTNVISVRSFDASSNASPVVQRTIVRVLPGTIRVAVSGQGSVRGATNGQRLEIGQAYTIVATPARGFLFSNWTGSISLRSPALSFVMRSNLQVTANFVPNPFFALRGNYNGLFYDAQVQSDHSGSFTMTVTERGAYSASLLMRGIKLKTRGAFGLTGRATNDVLAPDGTPYTVTWAAALNGSDQISGTVQSGSWSATLAGDRQVFHSKTNPASQAGKYTFVILGEPQETILPGGDGFGVVTVNTKGVARLSGYLADNTRFVAMSPLSKAGDWPVYASLYARQGIIIGWVSFRDLATTDFDAVVRWTRPAMPGAHYYSAGFTSESTLMGSRFAPPLPGESVVSWPDPILRLEGGGLADSVTNRVTIRGSNVGSDGSNMIRGKFSAGTGVFGGTANVTGGAGRFVFKGVVLQKAAFGAGYIVGADQMGRIVLESAP